MNNFLWYGKVFEIFIIFDYIDGIRNCFYKDNGIGFDFKNFEN